MPTAIFETEIVDDVPWSDRITAYDRTHHGLYLRLLDATTAGACDADILRLVFGIDPTREPQRAAAVLASHMKRARWMRDTGYQQLLHS